jgi:hypothetical protein
MRFFTLVAHLATESASNLISNWNWSPTRTVRFPGVPEFVGIGPVVVDELPPAAPEASLITDSRLTAALCAFDSRVDFLDLVVFALAAADSMFLKELKD